MKKIWIILILGIILKLFIAATTYHPDMQTFNLTGSLIALGNVLNLYDYLPNLVEGDPLKNFAVFNYPPAIYWFFGFFKFIFSNLLGLKFLNGFIINTDFGNVLLNFQMLILKLPYLIFDILCGFIFLRIFNETKVKQLAFTLWIFNPINLFSTYMMGQFDIIPTFFTLLSIYLISRNKLEYAALALGGGIAFKIYPVFLVFPLLLLTNGYLNRIQIVILSFIPYIISILPYIFSSSFRTTALFASQSSKSLYASVSVSGGETILLFPAFLLLYFLFIWRNKITSQVWILYAIPLLLFFIFTHFHPQWLLWLTPFLIFDLSNSNYRNIFPILLIFFTFLTSLLFFDSSLTVNLFSPLVPGLKDLPSIWMMLGLNLDYNFSRSVIQTIFASSSIFLIYDYIKKKA